MVAGRPVVTNSEEKGWILGLREDPYLSALMACEMAKASRERLAGQNGRPLTKGDLYLAHFLGSGCASRLLKLVEDNPEGNAAKAFPAAAKANRSVFMKQDVKKHATVAEVRAQVSAMIEARVSRYASLALTPAEPVPSAFR